MKKLDDILYNTKSGYMSKNDFINNAKQEKINRKEAEEYYNNQDINQIFKNSNQKDKYIPIESPYHKPGDLQIDLMIMTRFPKNKNKGYQYLFNILDVYSRYVKSYPIKTKSSDDVYPHFKEYINFFRKIYPKNKITITMDKGSEFKGKVLRYIKENNFEIYYAVKGENTKNRNMLVERIHRTFWEKLRKVLKHNESIKWVDYYQDIIENYNNTIHSKTKMTPHSIFIKKETRDIDTLITKNIKINKNLQIGDYVRVLKNKGEMTKKSFTNNWSFNKYIIDKIEGNRYYLKYKNGNKKKNSYLERELQKVDGKDDDKNKILFNEQMKEQNKINKKIRTLRKEKIHIVNDSGEYIIDKRLIPKSNKRTNK